MWFPAFTSTIVQTMMISSSGTVKIMVEEVVVQKTRTLMTIVSWRRIDENGLGGEYGSHQCCFNVFTHSKQSHDFTSNIGQTMMISLFGIMTTMVERASVKIRTVMTIVSWKDDSKNGMGIFDIKTPMMPQLWSSLNNEACFHFQITMISLFGMTSTGVSMTPTYRKWAVLVQTTGNHIVLETKSQKPYIVIPFRCRSAVERGKEVQPILLMTMVSQFSNTGEFSLRFSPLYLSM
jgi:hypothetical protein